MPEVLLHELFDGQQPFGVLIAIERRQADLRNSFRKRNKYSLARRMIR
jgi:hypothetical protein